MEVLNSIGVLFGSAWGSGINLVFEEDVQVLEKSTCFYFRQKHKRRGAIGGSDAIRL